MRGVQMVVFMRPYCNIIGMFPFSRQFLHAYVRMALFVVVAALGVGNTVSARVVGTDYSTSARIVSTDYSTDGRLIDVRTAEQLNAIRWDLDGDGVPTYANRAAYFAAFPDAMPNMGCASACAGYALYNDIDLGASRWSRASSTEGWEPIGTCRYASGCYTYDPGYAAAFKGNGHVIHNLFIQRPRENYVGLFGFLRPGSRIEGVGLRDASIEGDRVVGGLAGQAGMLATIETAIISSYMTGNVNGAHFVGGLVGVHLGEAEIVGEGEIVASSATGVVSGTGISVGGLVGVMVGGEIVSSYATGAVSGEDAVGGLVGGMFGGAMVASSETTGAGSFMWSHHWGEIVSSYATGAVSGTGVGVGGLVGGMSGGEIVSSYATGVVSGEKSVGGLVGGMSGGEIIASSATGAASGKWNVGGLVGDSWGREIVSSYATGAVSGTGVGVGGLVGLMFEGEIVASYATGAVSGERDVGGLVGDHRGEIVASYATGAVSGERYVGGLVGWSYRGEIVASYAMGAVSGEWDVGGLVGDNRGEIVASYAMGAVSGTSSVGGLVGRRKWNGTTTASYWDTLTSGRESSAGGTGKRTFELRAPTAYTGIYAAWNVDVDNSTATGVGGKDDPWDFGTEDQYPILRYGHSSASVSRQQSPQPEISTDGSLRGLSVSGVPLSPDFSGSVTSYYAVADHAVVSVAATATDAGARVEISPRDADSGVGGHQVRLGAGTTNTVVVTVTAEDGSATEYVVVVGYDGVAPTFGVAATTLTYVAGGLVDETLPVARGGDGELSYTLTDAGGKTRTLMLPSGLKFDAASRRLYGRPTTASSSRYVLTAADGNGDVSPADAARMSIAIVVLPNHDGDGDGLIEVTSLEQLNAIRWDLDGDGVPTPAGAASYAAAFPNAGGVVCRQTTGVVACEGYELVSDLDFNTGASTRTDDLYYNGGAGWEPIGTCGTVYAYGCNTSDPGYAASFRGNSHVIHNLFIQRPRENYVGLFGFVGPGSRIEGVRLRDVSIEGRRHVGGLAGQAGVSTGTTTVSLAGSAGVRNTTGTMIISIHVTGAVSGVITVGGLAGLNEGEIVASYAMGAVSGWGSVGGLVGRNLGGIAASYATGAVSGEWDIGGLVGENHWEIVASYAMGAVSGTSSVGGLVGDNQGEMVASYATGAVSGERYVGGLVGENWGEIVASYAMGAVSVESRESLKSYVGGLVGWNRYGTTTASYWDTWTSGRESSAGGTGKRTSELRSPTTYTGIYATWNVDVGGDDTADAPWDFGTESQYPILRYGHSSASVSRQQSPQPEISTDGSLRGLSVSGAPLSPDFSGSVTSYYAVADHAVVSVAATATDAGARVEISPRDADNGVGGHQVRLRAGTTNTVVVTVTAEDGSATEYVVVVGYGGVAPTFGVAATTLTYVAGGLVDETLPVARGGDGELSYTLTDAGGKTRTLTLPPGLKFDAAARRLYGRPTTASSSRYTLTATDDDGSISSDDTARMSIAIIVLPTHDGNRNGLIEVSSLEQLNAIRWDLDGDGVPTPAGAASYAAAFPNVGGVVCRTTTGVVACEGYELVSDLDFNTGASTRTDDLYYNGGAGWEPIGTCDAVYAYGCNTSDPGYAAAFRGNGHVIHNLFIQRPREKYVGLFGFVSPGSSIEGVGLRDVSIEGDEFVGGLAGQAGAWEGTTGTVIISSYGTAIISSYATGVVSGEWDVGGLVGYMNLSQNCLINIIMVASCTKPKKLCA